MRRVCNNYLLLLQYTVISILAGREKSATNTFWSAVVNLQIVITHAHKQHHQLLRNMTYAIVNRLRRFTTKYAKKKLGVETKSRRSQKAGL